MNLSIVSSTHYSSNYCVLLALTPMPMPIAAVDAWHLIQTRRTNRYFLIWPIWNRCFASHSQRFNSILSGSLSCFPHLGRLYSPVVYYWMINMTWPLSKASKVNTSREDNRDTTNSRDHVQYKGTYCNCSTASVIICQKTKDLNLCYFTFCLYSKVANNI